MEDLGSVSLWLEKSAIPKGSKYTKRFGQKYLTSPMSSVVGKPLAGRHKSPYTKVAVGTGDDTYEAPTQHGSGQGGIAGVGSYGQHKHVHGEAECHLCKGQPLVEIERNDKTNEDKTAESHDSVEYHEILKIVAEAHGVDLTKPESIDLLPALLREADHVMMKHEKLESAEEEMNEQMMGQHEQPE